MRKEFSEVLHEFMSRDRKIILLTGDLGYGLWDKIKIDYPDRFYNVGSSEQLMMGIATGLAMEDKIPVVYSITPFLLYRPFEFIRNYVDHERWPIKLVGAGRDKDYGYLGFSHWAEEDKQIMSCFKNIKSYWPESIEEMRENAELIFHKEPHIPSYLNLRRK
jgi:transketolase